MDNRTAIMLSSLTFIAGIGIGHFATNSAATSEPLATHLAEASTTTGAQTKVSADTPANANKLAAAAKVAFNNKDFHSSSSTSIAAETPAATATPPAGGNSADGSADAVAKPYPNEITAEEIDQVIPAPFNESFKRNHGFLREKYKDFVANTQPSDWDSRTQNKITDFILSSPYAKFLNIEYLVCKSGLCEIRLFETKQGTFSMILSEMALQDWWDIGGYHASGNQASEGRTAYHVLLPRK